MKSFWQFVQESKTAEADKLPLKDGIKMAKELLKKLGVSAVEKIGPNTKGKPNKGYLVGSIRRQKSKIGDIDLLVTKKLTPEQILEIDGVEDLTSRGSKQIFFDYKGFPINIWMLPKEQLNSFGAFVMHTTGSSHYNMLMRMIAKRNGLKLNQYGIFNKANEQIGGETEQSIYDQLKTKKWTEGKPWKEPKGRE